MQSSSFLVPILNNGKTDLLRITAELVQQWLADVGAKLPGLGILESGEAIQEDFSDGPEGLLQESWSGELIFDDGEVIFLEFSPDVLKPADSDLHDGSEPFKGKDKTVGQGLDQLAASRRGTA